MQLHEVAGDGDPHAYDDEGHGLAKRANRLDAYPKAPAFLRRHVAEQSA